MRDDDEDLRSMFYAQASPEEAAEQAASDDWWRLDRLREQARAGYEGGDDARD